MQMRMATHRALQVGLKWRMMVRASWLGVLATTQGLLDNLMAVKSEEFVSLLVT